MKTTLLLLLLLLPPIALAGCGGGTDYGDAGSGVGRGAEETGTVRHIALEGGFYGIVTDTGANYLPINLGNEFRQDGLRVRFEKVQRSDVVTIYMWGVPVELTKIETLSPGTS